MERTYQFRDVRAALAFIKEVGRLTNRVGGHPKIIFGWRYVTISLPARNTEGSEASDFIMAAKFDQAAQQTASRAQQLCRARQ